MWIDNPVHKEDLDSVCGNQLICWDDFREKSFLITGATGLIGQTIVNVLTYANIRKQLNLRIYTLVRNIQKAKELFKEQIGNGNCINLIEGTIEQLPDLPSKMDYIIHGASITSSLDFIHHPVEVNKTAFYGTDNILEYARKIGITKMVYLSSMEVYGSPSKGEKVKEDNTGKLQPTVIRNSYPLGKQMCENLCCSYASEFGVPVCIARLTQTFGPGIRYDDKRVFAEFARCAIEKKDVVLKTRGETERQYLYTTDAVSAILLLLISGNIGEAYNVANEETYCSIAQMADTVAEISGIGVRYDIQNTSQFGYANTLYMNLDTTKIKELGWEPTRNMQEMYRRLICVMENSEQK